MHGPGGLLPSRRQSHITAVEENGEKETCRQCASDIKLWLFMFSFKFKRTRTKRERDGSTRDVGCGKG